MKKIFYLLIVFPFCINAQVKEIDRVSFIDTITYQYYNNYDREDNDYPDYFLLLHVSYKDFEKDVIVLNSNFVYVCLKQYKLDNLTARKFIKDAILNNKTIHLPAEKRKTKDLYNSIFDTDYIDTIITDKYAFIDYYFDENKRFKREATFQTYNDSFPKIHNIHFNISGVIAQLIKWNIPVYLKEGDGIYYGYYWENKQNQIYKD